MRMDQGNTMRPEPALYDAAFQSYAFHKVYKLVEGITHKIYILEGHTSTQKMRMDQGEHDATRASPLRRHIPELRLPLGVQVSGRHNSQNIHSRGPHIHSKDAYGSREHDATRASPLRRYIPELRLPLGVQVSGRHNSQNIHFRGPHIDSKMRMEQGNTMRPEPALYDAVFLSYGRH